MAGLLTAEQVAEEWQCSPSHVRRLARQQQLAAVRIGADWRFSLQAVEAYEAARTTAAAVEQPAPAVASQPSAHPLTGVPDLPADYEPVFKDLWADRAASPAAGRGRSPKTRKRA